MPKTSDEPDTRREGAPSTGHGVRPAITTERLFQGQREIRLVHHGESYSLRITAAGKLILTK